MVLLRLISFIWLRAALLGPFYATVIMLSCLYGCAHHKTKPVAQWSLTPEAQVMYGVLLLEQSIRAGDRSGIFEAMDVLEQYKPDVQFFTDSAAWFLLQREPATARIFLEKGLKKHPNEFSFYLLLAESWLEENNPDKALEVFQTYKNFHPQSNIVRQELGILYLKAGKYKEAANCFKALPKKYLTPFIRYCYAQALVGMGKSKGGMSQLRLAVKEKPEFLEAWFEIGKLQENEGNYAAAIDIYNDLLDKDSSNQEVWFHLISAMLSTKNLKKALAYVNEAPQSYGFYLTVAVLFIEKKYYGEAEVLLKNLEQRGGGSPDINFFFAAIAYEYHKNLSEAMESLQKVPPESKYYVNSLLLRAQIFYSSNEVYEALKLLRQAQEHSPKAQELRLMELHVLLAEKRYDESLSRADDGLKSIPNNKLILLLKGVALDGLGKREEALQFMEGVLLQYPDYPEALNFIGYMLVEENRELERALILIKKADRLMPNRAYIIDSLAWAFFIKGDAKSAWKEIQRAIMVEEGNDPTIWDHYGDIAFAVGEKNIAKQAWERALELEPKHPEKIHIKLNQL